MVIVVADIIVDLYVGLDSLFQLVGDSNSFNEILPGAFLIATFTTFIPFRYSGPFDDACFAVGIIKVSIVACFDC